MKKLILGSIAFLIFAGAMNILQTSCKKDANASSNEPNGLMQLNKIIFTKTFKDFHPYLTEIWIANYDGTDENKVNIVLPEGYVLTPDENHPHLSPDGKTIVFTVMTQHANPTYIHSIWKCNIDGTNLQKVIEPNGNYYIRLSSAH